MFFSIFGSKTARLLNCFPLKARNAFPVGLASLFLRIWILRIERFTTFFRREK